MTDFFNQAITGLLQQSPIEHIASGLGLAYLILIMRQNVWGWPCALISTALFTYIFWDVSLFMESLLNVYYMGMAVYGFWNWNRTPTDKPTLPIIIWPLKTHALALGAIFILSGASGYYLTTNTTAAWPYLDSFTTWGAVITTYMVAQKVFENWFYWLVIDAVALYLYIDRGLYSPALLMVVYIILIVVGLITWARQLQQQESPASNHA